MTFLYLDLHYVILIHDSIIESRWWLAWTKDEQQIESTLQHIQNNDYYPELIDKVTHLFFWLCKFHCFNDWNKRTTLSVTKVFLEMNWHTLDDFLINMEDIIVDVADDKISKEKLHEILYFYINEKDLT